MVPRAPFHERWDRGWRSCRSAAGALLHVMRMVMVRLLKVVTALLMLLLLSPPKAFGAFRGADGGI